MGASLRFSPDRYHWRWFRQLVSCNAVRRFPMRLVASLSVLLSYVKLTVVTF